jgi:murein DD-endopeptidase MepM/ murein hydrolase activator NlpD
MFQFKELNIELCYDVSCDLRRSEKGVFHMMRCCVFALVLSCILCPNSRAQLGGFHCPMDGAPQIRQGDSVAPSGGRFDSSRGSGKKHGALDLNGRVGDPVYASLDGRIAVAQLNWGAMGNTVIIDHGSGAYTVYGHLTAVSVREGSQVKTGDKIGTVGYTGNASALQAAGLPPHLHFALIQAGKSGLADAGKPLTQMKAWGDYWQSLGADLTGPVDPMLFMAGDRACWTGSTTVNAPGER